MVWDTQSWCRVYFYATVHPVDTKKKQGVYLMVVGAAVLVGALAFVFVSLDTVPDEEPTATSTPEVATTTDIFDMEPIIPEAKVSTEGWKTCRNEEYGWEVQYPGEWYVYGEGHHSGEEGSTWGGYYANETPCVGGHVVLAEWEPGTGFASVSQLDRISITADPQSFSSMVREVGDIRILVRDHLKSLELRAFIVGATEYAWLEDDSRVIVLGYHNDNLFEISARPRLAHTLEAMLTTFRFLDTATSTPE